MVKWQSPSGHRYKQLNNSGKLILFNMWEMKLFDSERHAIDLGWKKITVENKD